jgi:hypothetical protein
MQVSTILDHIDNGHMALPEFQRGYVWNRDQVRGLMDSLYQRHPIGSLLVWATRSEGAQHRGDGELAPGVVKLLLDGQQRMTSLYGIVRGAAPKFFDGNARAFTGLRFHLEQEEFAFYQPIKMKDDPLWVDVSEVLQRGNDGLGELIGRLGSQPDLAAKTGTYVGRLSRILGIRDVDLHIEEVTGQDKDIDVVVDIFNRVNSGGTKLSKGDLALAKICADWPDARERMKKALHRWNENGFHFDLDWFLRNVNVVVTGEAKFSYLHSVPAGVIQEGLDRTERAIDFLLNAIAGRLGLDHDRVFFGRYAMPVMVHYLVRRGGKITDQEELDRLLYWYLQSAMWGRFSGSTESLIDKDLHVLEELEGGLDRLIAQLRLWHGSLEVAPGHFGGWSLGARFYPVLYLLTRVGEALDWGTGLPLKKHMLGRMSNLEVHHIFPKKVLYARNHRRPDVNAVANFCLQTKETNLWIGARRPVEYFAEVEEARPGALATQWIPMEERLWQEENYLEFLEARRELLAGAANDFLAGLRHGGIEEDRTTAAAVPAPVEVAQSRVLGGVDSEEEEAELLELNAWILDQGLPEGLISHELAEDDTGDPVAILDIAWPEGLQEGLSRPVALLLNEGQDLLRLVQGRGFLFFTSVAEFRAYVEREVLVLEDE